MIVRLLTFEYLRGISQSWSNVLLNEGISADLLIDSGLNEVVYDAFSDIYEHLGVPFYQCGSNYAYCVNALQQSGCPARGLMSFFIVAISSFLTLENRAFSGMILAVTSQLWRSLHERLDDPAYLQVLKFASVPLGASIAAMMPNKMDNATSRNADSGKRARWNNFSRSPTCHYKLHRSTQKLQTKFGLP